MSDPRKRRRFRPRKDRQIVRRQCRATSDGAVPRDRANAFGGSHPCPVGASASGKAVVAIVRGGSSPRAALLRAREVATRGTNTAWLSAGADAARTSGRSAVGGRASMRERLHAAAGWSTSTATNRNEPDRRIIDIGAPPRCAAGRRPGTRRNSAQLRYCSWAGAASPSAGRTAGGDGKIGSRRQASVASVWGGGYTAALRKSGMGCPYLASFVYPSRPSWSAWLGECGMAVRGEL